MGSRVQVHRVRPQFLAYPGMGVAGRLGACRRAYPGTWRLGSNSRFKEREEIRVIIVLPLELNAHRVAYGDITRRRECE